MSLQRQHYGRLIILFLGILLFDAVPSNSQQGPQTAILIVDDFNSQSESYLLDFTNEIQEMAADYMSQLPEISRAEAYAFLQSGQASGAIPSFTQLVSETGLYQEMIGTDDNCALNLSEQRVEARGAGSGESSFTPHGQIVKAVLEELQSKHPLLGASSIDIIEVDTQGFSTSVIADQITSNLIGGNYDFYVVNMSFAIVPCEYVVDLAAYDALVLNSENSASVANLHDAVLRIFSEVFGTALDQGTSNLTQVCSEVVPCDPLQDVMLEYVENTIFVGAAGNSGLGFPFYPAAWPQVVSVSASEEQLPLLDDYLSSGRKAIYSNKADVMMPGSWEDGSPNGITGTSFAAPRLSFLLALYLAGEGGDVCQKPIPPSTTPSPGLYSGNWNDDPIEVAASANCIEVTKYRP